MIAWKINRIPISEENTHQYMRSILFSLQNLCDSNISLELSFSHTSGEEIDIYVFLRNTNNRNIVSAIETQLKAANYQCKLLDDQAANAISQQLIDIACSELNAVIKTEKIVTTPFMQEQYYYWADVLLAEDGKGCDNLAMLFQSLQKCGNSFVSFQLMPTTMQDYEANVLQYLNMHLEPHVRNSMPNTYGMSMYEPYAQPAYNAYRHYMDKRGQPIYQYNIAVGSMSGNSGFLANQVIASIKAQASNAPELQAIPVRLNRYAFNADSFPTYLSSFLQQQCRDRFIWGGNIIPPNALFRFPFLVTADEALMFFRLPYDDGKIVGFSGSIYHLSNELLSDVVTNPNNITFGKNVANTDTSIGVPAKQLSQHALIVGMPGTGKTTFCINLLLQFQKKGISFLAIEPTKTEYRAMIDAIPNLQVFTPGNNSLSPFIINPFIPPKGISLERYVPSLYNAFKAAFSMPSPLDVVFLKAIRAAYNRYGWRDYSVLGDPGTKLFGLHEFILIFKQVVDESDYAKDVKGNLRSGGVFRLSNLINQNRNIFDTIHSIPIEDILNKPTVLELNAIDDIEQKALIIALLLMNVVLYAKNTQTKGTDLQSAILIDEAHVLLAQCAMNQDGKPDAQGYTARFVENMIAEIRSYGTSVIISDQRPKAVGEAVVANTDIKIAFRLTDKAEKGIIGNSMDMNEYMYQQLSQLEKGQAFTYHHKLKKPQMLVTPDVRAEEGIRIEVSDDEIRCRNHYWDDRMDLLKPYAFCSYCKCVHGCNFRLRADAEYYCNLIWNRNHRKITNVELLLKYIYGIPVLIKTSLKKYDHSDREVLVKCICIALQRKAALEKGLILDDNKMKQALGEYLNGVLNDVLGV